MSDFMPYTEPSVPTQVRKVEVYITSELIPDMTVELPGQPSEFLGTYTDLQSIQVRAIVCDQTGCDFLIHTSTDPQDLINKGVFTPEELQTIQDWLTNLRATVETLVLAAA